MRVLGGQTLDWFTRIRGGGVCGGTACVLVAAKCVFSGVVVTHVGDMCMPRYVCAFPLSVRVRGEPMLRRASSPRVRDAGPRYGKGVARYVWGPC